MEITDIQQLREIIAEPSPGLEAKNIPYLDTFACDFISKSPFIILSTSDEDGRCDGSPKGDAPGFVEVVDEHTLLIPDRPGNRLAYGHKNILANPNVAVLFCIPGTTETLRVSGKAVLTADPAVLDRLAARGKPAVLSIRVTVEECFFHCSKAFIRSNLWHPEQWVNPAHKVSFGEIYRARFGISDDEVQAFEASLADEYENNL